MKSNLFLLSFAFALIVSVVANAVDRLAAPEGRITNGQLAADGQFPYICSLEVHRLFSAVSCTCSLISPEWVLTAAHCVTNNAKQAFIAFGSTTRNTPTLRRRVESKDFFVHDKWNPNTLAYDAALLRTEFITYTTQIQPVALPAFCSPCPSGSYLNQLATIVGWGKTDVNRPAPNVLYFGSARIIYDENLWVKIDTQPSSTCFGDSGGPLILNINGRHTQVGITSYVTSSKCASGNTAGFTRIYAIMDWIQSKTGIL